MADPVELAGERKISRFFRARKKLTQASVISHITQRAAGKEPCFVEDEDYLCMLGFLKESSHNHDYDVYSLCLMENHVHLLLQTREGNLSVAMKDLFSRYAMRFNRKYERRGHLFGGPFRQAVCLDRAYLLAASTYIHLNPVKAGIVSDPRDYRWSSARLFTEDWQKDSFVDAAFILRMLSEDISDASKQYRKILMKGSRLPIDYAKTQEIGVEHYKQKLLSALPGIFRKFSEGKPVAKTGATEIWETEELERKIDETLALYGIRKPGSRAAMKFLIEQMIARGFKRYEIAERLGLSPKTVYNLLHHQR